MPPHAASSLLTSVSVVLRLGIVLDILSADSCSHHVNVQSSVMCIVVACVSLEVVGSAISEGARQAAINARAVALYVIDRVLL